MEDTRYKADLFDEKKARDLEAVRMQEPINATLQRELHREAVKMGFAEDCESDPEEAAEF